MGRRNPDGGLLVFDTRLIPSALTDQGSGGAGSSDSSFTQAGPQPGQPVNANVGSRWRPQMVGAQSIDVRTITLRGGYPGKEGASVAYRLESDTGEATWRGWNEPNLLLNVSAPTGLWDEAATTIDRAAAAAHPDTGEIVVVARYNAGAKTFRYDPRTQDWDAGQDLVGTLLVAASHLEVVWDPTREAFLLYNGSGSVGDDGIYGLISTDKGDTWSVFTRGHFDVDTSAGRLSVAPQPTGAWLALSDDGTNGDTIQLASYDAGVTWKQVDTVTTLTNSASSQRMKALPMPSGGFLVVYLDNAAQHPTARRLGDASDPIGSATAIDIDSTAATTFEAINAVVDEDGIVYVYGEHNGAIACWRSLDEGATWESYGFTTETHAAGLATLDGMVASVGEVHAILTEQTASYFDSSLGGCLLLMTFGGWSTLEAGPYEIGVSQRVNRMDWADGGVSYHGAYDPASGAVWTLTGSAGANSGSGPWFVINPAAAQSSYARSFVHVDESSGLVRMKFDTGGAQTDDTLAIQVRVADGAIDYDARLRIYESVGKVGIRTWDEHGAAQVDDVVTAIDKGAWFYLAWRVVDSNKITVWVRAATDRTWTEIADGTLTDGGAGPTTNQVAWGAIDSGSVNASFAIVAYSSGAAWRTELDSLSTLRSGTGLMWGKALPARGQGSYPIPEATLTTENVARIFGADGPTKIGEVVQHPAGYEFPFADTHPTVSPTRDSGWKSTDQSLVLATWDMGANGAIRVGAAIGLCVLDAFARQWTVEHSANGTAWTTAFTLDLAIGTTLNSTKAGRTFTPRTATTDVARYIGENELVGDYLIASAGGGTVALEIESNTAGYWTADSGVQKVFITVKGDASSADTSGTVDIVASSGVHVEYLTAEVPRRYWRVSVAASQDTPGSVYKASIVGLGQVYGLGSEAGWSWTRRLLMARELTRDPQSQIPTIRQTGRIRQSWSQGYQEGGLLVRELRRKAVHAEDWADWVGITGGLEIGTKEDTWHTVWGLADRMKSGEIPVVLLPQLPDSSGAILDPTMYLYASLVSGEIQVQGVDGFEGTNEHVRLGDWTFEGL